MTWLRVSSSGGIADAASALANAMVDGTGAEGEGQEIGRPREWERTGPERGLGPCRLRLRPRRDIFVRSGVRVLAARGPVVPQNQIRARGNTEACWDGWFVIVDFEASLS